MGNSGEQLTANLPYPKFGKRHILVLWLLTGFTIIYIIRVSLNVAIVSMVRDANTTKPSTNASNSTSSDGTCPIPADSSANSNNSSNSTKQQGEFDWDHETRGVILSSFFYGYITTQFIGGYLPQIIGGRVLFGICVGGPAVLSLFVPLAARASPDYPTYLILIRVLMGILQGVSFPCNHYLLGNWVPKQERSFLVSIPTSGTNTGTVLAAPLTGLLCEYGFDGGWPTAFYVWGIVGLIWCVGWFWAVRDSPDQHPTISLGERQYIEANCQSKSKHTPFLQVPWKSMLLSGPVWGIIIMQTAYTWNYYTLLTELSSYLKDVLHISKSLNGLVTSLPYICMWVVSLGAGFLSDLIRAKGVPTKWVRIGGFGLGMIGSSIGLIVIGYAGCDSTVVVVLLCISIGFVGFAYAAFIVNHVDIAPQYAGLLMGIANTFGTLSGIISPIITGAIVNKASTTSTWQTVFYISAGISTGGAIFFGLLGDGEVQKWALVTPGGQDGNNIDANEAKNDIDAEVEKVGVQPAVTAKSGDLDGNSQHF